jgi:hypothetical protein
MDDLARIASEHDGRCSLGARDEAASWRAVVSITAHLRILVHRERVDGRPFVGLTPLRDLAQEARDGLRKPRHARSFAEYTIRNDTRVDGRPMLGVRAACSTVMCEQGVPSAVASAVILSRMWCTRSVLQAKNTAPPRTQKFDRGPIATNLIDAHNNGR